jgi:hypothetical protein
MARAKGAYPHKARSDMGGDQTNPGSPCTPAIPPVPAVRPTVAIRPSRRFAGDAMNACLERQPTIAAWVPSLGD